MIIHITAGSLALVSGFVALFATKGSLLHRRSGLLFAASMLVMSGTGAYIAAFVKPNAGSVVAGVLTFYMICTAVLTVRTTVAQSRAAVTGLMLVALTASAFAFACALAAMNHPRGHLEGIPAAPLFMFGFIGLMAAFLDARLLLAGHIEGAHRLARHLWRMGYAMFVATTSFFLGQAKFIPQSLRKVPLLVIPVLVVVVLTMYWLVRTLRRRRLPKSTPPRAQGTPHLGAGAAP